MSCVINWYHYWSPKVNFTATSTSTEVEISTSNKEGHLPCEKFLTSTTNSANIFKYKYLILLTTTTPIKYFTWPACSRVFIEFRMFSKQYETCICVHAEVVQEFPHAFWKFLFVLWCKLHALGKWLRNKKYFDHI